VDSSDALGEAIRDTRPGEGVHVVVFREGKVIKLQVVMGASDTEGLTPGRLAQKYPDPAKKSMEDFKKQAELFKEYTEQHGDTRKEHLDAYRKYAEEYKNNADPWKTWMYVTGDDRPFMGIGHQDLTDQLAEFFQVEHGILISMVEENSPAQQAGLKAGDVLISWNGKEVKNTDRLYELLGKAEEGDSVGLVIVRKGEKQDKTIVLGERKEDEPGRFHYYYKYDPNPNSGFFRYYYRWPHEKSDAPPVPLPYAVPEPPVLPEPPSLPDQGWFEVKPAPQTPGIEDSVRDLKKMLHEQQQQLKELKEEIKKLKKREKRTGN
jgi:hypothetical protein